LKKPVVLVIDGQGGRIGRLLVEALATRADQLELVCVGTNSIATSTMMKAGAARGGTGENAVIVNCRTADFIIGPLGLVIADSMMGEITPAMACAVGQSAAMRLLIPLNLCGSVIIGAGSFGIKEMIALAVAELERHLVVFTEA
jgi:hypothetical protein